MAHIFGFIPYGIPQNIHSKQANITLYARGVAMSIKLSGIRLTTETSRPFGRPVGERRGPCASHILTEALRTPQEI